MNDSLSKGGADASARQMLVEMFEAALLAVDPYQAVLNVMTLSGDELHVAGRVFDLGKYTNITVIGAGKATARMALAVESLLADRVKTGLVVVKTGHTESLRHIALVEASHPVPDEAGVAATARILAMAQQADADTLIICLLSGGASALLVAPDVGLSLQDKQNMTRLLLNAGANINELNMVRKHLSAVKGGKLALAAYPAQLVTLILSDVIGDFLDVIASGPTSADDSSFADAQAVILRHGLSAPSRVTNHLAQGIASLVAETVKTGDTCLTQAYNFIVANSMMALAAAQLHAQAAGWQTVMHSVAIQGEARDAARELASRIRGELQSMQLGERRCLLSGGETTVTVQGRGQGGRNQEFALAFAIAIAGMQGVSLLSAGTDGSDGDNDAAGAAVNGDTVARALSMGLDASSYLADNDSYHYFARLDELTGSHTHLKTGPTGTNVMDIQIVLLEKAAAALRT